MSDTPPATDTSDAPDDFAEHLIAHLERDLFREEGAGDGPAGSAGASDAVLVALTSELRAESTWSSPPPSLRDSIMDRVRASAATAATAAGQTDVDAERSMLIEPINIDQKSSTSSSRVDIDSKPSTSTGSGGIVETGPVTEVEGVQPWPQPRRRWGWPRWGQFGWAIPVAALVAVVFTVGVLLVDRALQPAEPERTVYAATGAGPAPQASARIGVAEAGAGFSLQVTARDLPAAAPGSYYAAWLRGPNGTVPLGSFHQRQAGKVVTLWSGVDPADYPEFTVTLQAEGEPPGPSDRVVLTAMLRR